MLNGRLILYRGMYVKEEKGEKKAESHNDRTRGNWSFTRMCWK